MMCEFVNPGKIVISDWAGGQVFVEPMDVLDAPLQEDVVPTAHGLRLRPQGRHRGRRDDRGLLARGGAPRFGG